MSDAKQAALAAAKKDAAIRLVGRPATGASVTTAGTSNTVFGVPVGIIVVGVALLGVVGVIVLRMVKR